MSYDIIIGKTEYCGNFQYHPEYQDGEVIEQHLETQWIAWTRKLGYQQYSLSEILSKPVEFVEHPRYYLPDNSIPF